VGQVDRLFLGRARAAAEEQSVYLRPVFALDEQLVERRMAQVGSVRCEHNFAVTGQHQPAGLVAVIDQGNAPELDVVVWRNGDLHVQRDVVISAPEFSLVGVEEYLLAFWWGTGWLVTCRPEVAAIFILDVEPGSPVVQSGIGTPAGEVHPLPTAVAAAGAGDEQVVMPVGEEMHLW
jgi:hypothetical protein